MATRLLFGIAAATLAGLIWTSVDREAKPEFETESQVEQPLTEVESPPSHTATRAGATRAGGLPARDRSARGRQPGTATPPARPTSTGTRQTAPPARSASTDPASTRAAARGTLASVEGSSQPSSVDSAATADEERSRSHDIAGTVLEKGGSPVAGLAVGLTTRRLFDGAAAPSAARTVTTDGRGSFAFGVVPDGEYEIRTEKNDRYESAVALVRAGTDAAVLVVEPSSDKSLAIRGVVESTSGGVLDGVRVQAIGQTNLTAVTDAKGAYVLRIPAGGKAERTALQFRRAGYRDRRWTMSDGLRSNDYEVIGNVRLEPDAAGVSVNGVVTATSGAPVPRVQVQLNSATRGRTYRAITDAGGRFTIANVETGTDYRVWARAQTGFRDGVLENVVVDAGTTAIDIELTPIGAATLRGRMVAPDGAPVAGFTMFLTSAYAGGPRSAAVTGDGQGRFVVNDLPEGRVVLQTRGAPAISVSGIELPATGSGGGDVTVVVDVGAYRFTGRLLTSDGAPAAGATVSLESSASIGGITSRSSRQTTADADGHFTFTQLGGGMHAVSAALAGAGSVRLELSISAGMEPLHITLPGKRGRQ